METTLSIIIKRLKKTSAIKDNSNYVTILTKIDKYGENANLKAFLLGHFFKHNLDSDNLPLKEKELLIDTIKKLNLEKFYYQKEPPSYKNNFIIFFSCFFIIFGILSVAIGLTKIYNNDFSFGVGTKYLVPTVRAGGYNLLLGLICFFSGLIRIIFEFNKRKFIAGKLEKK